jgi:LysM repeat protein
MYYNSSKNNNDYYNAYKQEMEEIEEYRDEPFLNKIIKIGLTLVILGGLAIFSLYLINFISTDEARASLPLSKQTMSAKEEEPPRVVFSKNMLPKSIQLQKSNLQNIEQIKLNATDSADNNENISPKDIALIVEIIISQMKQTKKPSLEKQLSLAQKSNQNRQSLKETNHYNKIIVSNTLLENRENKQVELKEQLNSIVYQSNNHLSSYEIAIKRELQVRSNEMRIIVVQKGDTLSKIAKKAYGNRDAYTKIFTANPEVLKNPNQIFVGQRLRIPA